MPNHFQYVLGGLSLSSTGNAIGYTIQSCGRPMAMKSASADTPGRDDEYDGDQFLAPVSFSLRGLVKGTTWDDLEDKIDALRAVCAGRNRVKFYRTEGRYRMVKCIGQSGLDDEAGARLKTAAMDFELVLKGSPFEIAETPTTGVLDTLDPEDPDDPTLLLDAFHVSGGGGWKQIVIGFSGAGTAGVEVESLTFEVTQSDPSYTGYIEALSDAFDPAVMQSLSPDQAAMKAYADGFSLSRLSFTEWEVGVYVIDCLAGTITHDGDPVTVLGEMPTGGKYLHFNPSIEPYNGAQEPTIAEQSADGVPITVTFRDRWY